MVLRVGARAIISGTIIASTGYDAALVGVPTHLTG